MARKKDRTIRQGSIVCFEYRSNTAVGRVLEVRQDGSIHFDVIFGLWSEDCYGDVNCESTDAIIFPYKLDNSPRFADAVQRMRFLSLYSKMCERKLDVMIINNKVLNDDIRTLKVANNTLRESLDHIRYEANNTKSLLAASQKLCVAKEKELNEIYDNIHVAIVKIEKFPYFKIVF